MPVNVFIEENILIKEYIKRKLKKMDKMTVKEKEGKNMKMRVLDEWINDTEPFFKNKFKNIKDIEKHPLFKLLLEPKKEYNQEYCEYITSEINSLNKKLKIASQLGDCKELINGIFISDSYLDYRATLDIVCYFWDRGYEVKLEPKLEPLDQKSKKMDVSVKLKDRFVHFECYHPNIEEKDENKLFDVGEQDYMKNSLEYAIRKILEKVNKRQIIEGEPNIFLIDVSDAKLEPRKGKTINIHVVSILVKRGAFKNHREYSAIVVYDRTQILRVIKHPNPKLRLTDEEIQIIGRKINL